MAKPIDEPVLYLYEERFNFQNQILLIGVRGNTHKFKPDKPIQVYGLRFLYNHKGEAICGANYYYRKLKEWPQVREEYENLFGKSCIMVSWRTDDYSVFDEINLWNRNLDTIRVITLEELLTHEHPFARHFGAKIATDGYRKTLSEYFRRIREDAALPRKKKDEKENNRYA